jgi:single-stranded-DNA-specific exonuclease
MVKQWNILNKSIKGDIISTILKGRGVSDVEHFLHPRKSDLLPFESLSNIEQAKDIVLEGIKNNKRFLVMFDIDNDGCCAGAIMYRYLKHYTDNVDWIINQGKVHGLEKVNLDEIVSRTDIFILCDSLSNNYKEYQYLFEKGVQVISLDHHSTDGSEYACIVNSKLNNYKNPYLAGAGVVWKFCAYLDKCTNNQYAYQYCDLAATGIIGDVQSVSEQSYENRFICTMGFNNLQNPGLKGIVDKYLFNGSCVGWSIAPLINSCQRSNNNELAVHLLLEDNPTKVKKIIAQLKDIKAEQDAEKDAIVNSLVFEIKNNQKETDRVISVFIDDKEHTGLVANTLAGMFMKPVIVLHNSEDGDEYRGSIRGFGVENFNQIVWDTKLGRAFGHENASGIFIKKSDYDKFIETINENLRHVEFKNIINADLQLEPEEVTYELIENLEYLNLVTGEGFKPVTIVMENIEVNNLTPLKPNHLKFEYKGIEFVFWKAGDKIQDFFSSPGTYRVMDVMGSLSISDFRGKKAKQFIISDYKNSREELEFLRDS